MDFNFQKMNQQDAEEIANNWKYDGIYSFYDFTNDPEDYMELINPDKRLNNYFSCYFNKELIGFCTIEKIDKNKVNLGLGLRPNFTGKGLGLNFLKAIMNYSNSIYNKFNFTLIVAQFNLRAIRVYEKAGFIKKKTFMQNTNGGQYEFIEMESKTNEQNLRVEIETAGPVGKEKC